MMIKLDGKEVKVGDRLWSTTVGWGKVTSKGGGIIWLNNGSFTDTYHPSGSKYHGCPRCLFWDEIDLTPPEPKQLIKKWQWAGTSFDGGFTSSVITEHLTEEEASDLYHTERIQVIGRIEGTEKEFYV